MTRTPNRLLQEIVHLLLGLVALAAVTDLYFWLKLPLVSAGFTYLIILVLLSLVSSFLSLAVLSLIAVGSLNYFFCSSDLQFSRGLSRGHHCVSRFFDHLIDRHWLGEEGASRTS